MPEKIVLTANKRKLIGKKVKQIRQQGFLPASVYGFKTKPENLQIKLQDFVKIYSQAGESLIYLKIDQVQKPVVVDQIQFHPINNLPIHVSFKQVDLKEKTKAEVGLELIGECLVPNAVVVLAHDKVEIESLPADIPESIKIDISSLKSVGDSIAFKDLVFDQAKIKLLLTEDQLNEPVVLVQEVKEEVVEVSPPEPTETEVKPSEAESESTQNPPTVSAEKSDKDKNET